MSFKTTDLSDTCEDAVYNPFQVEIHSLSLPACSPSVFSLVKTPEKPCMEESFRWSISQVAKMNPANIDESTQQSTLDEWDAEKEGRAQKAIEMFFLQNSICPSPWGEAMAFKRVTFSPNLASTAYFTNSNNSSFNICGRNETGESLGRKDAWTQTTLAIPKEVDLLKVLAEFFSFLEDQRENNVSIETRDLLSTSTLRRKLFSGSPTSRLKKDPETQRECQSVPLPFSPLKFCTPEKQLQSKPGCTPSSIGTFFSSSPISVKNCSISSSLIGQHRSSPPVSPIFLEKSSSKLQLSDKYLQEKLTNFSPSTSIATKNHLKSILKSSSCEERFHKPTSATFSVSMTSETSLDDEDQSQDINMDAGYEKSGSVQARSMQTSGVQYSMNELALNQSTECSAFFPSVLSQDTGYQTKSYQSEIGLPNDSSNNNNVELKERMLHNWLSHSRYGQVTDSGCLEIISEKAEMGNPIQNDGQDSMLLSQSNWKPSIFSTPH